MARWFDLGDVAVVPVVEIDRLMIDPREFFPDLPTMNGPYATEPWFDPVQRSLVFRMQAFVVVTRRRTILVDGCIGPGKSRMRPAFNDLDRQWLSRMAATGVNVEDVNDVIFTHLHVDHVGWATWKQDGWWEPVFTNARHLVTRRELEYWSSQAGHHALDRTGDYMADSVAPLRSAGLLEVVEPEFAVDEQVTMEQAAGHTPGNASVRVRGSAAELVLVGDVVHHPLQLQRPDLNTRYCVNPREATTTRMRILEQATVRGTILVPSHFAGEGAFRVCPAGTTGYHIEPAREVIRNDQFDIARWLPRD